MKGRAHWQLWAGVVSGSPSWDLLFLAFRQSFSL
jgi:hypothetical protein